MKDLDQKDTPEISGGEASTLVGPPAITYPIQPVTPEQPNRFLVTPESPLP